MKLKLIVRFTFLSLFIVALCHAQVKQVPIGRVAAMADLPKPLQIIDWRVMALDFDHHL